MSVEVELCDRRAEDEFEHCSGCYAFLSEENIYTIDHTTLCPHCIEEHTIICCQCGQRTLYPGTDNRLLCSSCEAEQKYDEFIAQLDFETLVCHIEYFESFMRNKTLALMSRLRRSYGENPSDTNQKPIDVLFLRKLIGDFVIMWNIPERLKNLSQYSCTLTDLKQNDVWHILHKETSVDKQILTLHDGRKFHVWEKPYKLIAQTKSDMDYGDHWEGQWLVHEGNKFGDASQFIIIGYIEP